MTAFHRSRLSLPLNLLCLSGWIGALPLALPGADAPEASSSLVEAPPPPPTNCFKPWPGQPPADCPFPRSESVTGLAFTGRHAEYTGADTWYPSWAADGNLYSPWTEGNVHAVKPGSPNIGLSEIAVFQAR